MRIACTYFAPGERSGWIIAFVRLDSLVPQVVVVDSATGELHRLNFNRVTVIVPL